MRVCVICIAGIQVEVFLESATTSDLSPRLWLLVWRQVDSEIVAFNHHSSPVTTLLVYVIFLATAK